MDGTSPYFVTNEKNLYFLDGTLDATYTRNLIGDSDFMSNHVLNIDTSLANNVFFPKDSSRMFSGLGNKEEFFRPEYLPKLDFSGVDTSSVKDMSSMFNGTTVSELDLSFFDTNSVTNMSHMFGTARVINVDMPDFKVESDTIKMSDSMFHGITADTISIPNFDGSKIQVLYKTFYRHI